MTPEERFTRIENFLSTVAEHQAHMSEQLARMSEQQAKLTEQQVNMSEQQAEFVRHELRRDKDMEELREIQKGMGLAIAKVAEEQRITEQKLSALIATVDRVIGKEGRKPS